MHSDDRAIPVNLFVRESGLLRCPHDITKQLRLRVYLTDSPLLLLFVARLR